MTAPTAAPLSLCTCERACKCGIVQAGGKCLRAAAEAVPRKIKRVGRKVAILVLASLGMTAFAATADSVYGPADADSILGDNAVRVTCRIGETWLRPDQLPDAQRIIREQRAAWYRQRPG